MARSPDGWAAARRLADAGDLAALAEHLRRHPPQPAIGARLFAHADPRVGHLVLSWLRRHLRRCSDREHLAAWAAALPRDLARWPARIQRSLARQFAQLRVFVDQLPDWRAIVDSEAAAIGWLATAIGFDPAAIVTEGATERLLHALNEVDGGELANPLDVVAALRSVGASTSVALRLLADAREAGLLTPAQVGVALHPWLATGDPAAWAAALHRWCPPDAVPMPLIGEALSDPARAHLAIRALARQQNGGVLLAIANGELPGPRALALAEAGAFADTAAELIQVAGADPLAYGDAVRGALTHAHRRGVFVQPADLVPLLKIFVIHRAWPAQDFTDLCHVARDALVERIAARPVDDPAWPRLIEVLALSEGRGASGAIRSVLGVATAPATIRAAIAAAGAREDAEAESHVLAWLATHPQVALRALTRIGGNSTARALQAGLGLDDAGQPAAWIPPWQTDALVLLWQLTPARTPLRAALLKRINPGAMPRPIARDIAAERSEAARRLALNAALFIRPDRALVRIADLGEDGAFDTLYGLLRETVVGLFDGTVPGDSPFDTAHTSGRPDLPSAVRDALLKYGQRLSARGRIRPVCLTRDAEPGAAMLVEACLDLALFGGLESAMQRCLLDAIQPHAAAALPRRLGPLLRSRAEDVRAAAVRLLVARIHTARPHTIARLLRNDAPASLRPAIAAVAEFQVDSAAPLVAQRLASPRLDVVRAAADALVRLDASGAVPALIEQLARQDEPALRRTVLAAYDTVDCGLGPIVDAIEAETDPTRRDRLLSALNRRLSPAWVRRLLVVGRPVGETLLGAIQDGRLTLDGSYDRLDAELVRHGLTPLRSPSTQPYDRLRRAGWSAALGKAVLADPTIELGRLIRRYGRELLGLSGRLDGEPLERLGVACEQLNPDVARGALPVVLDLLKRVQSDEAISGLFALLSRLGPGLPSFLAGQCVDVVRAVTVAIRDPLLRWQTLDRLGAVPGRADLDACLADGESPVAVLSKAFQARRVPRRPPDWATDEATPIPTTGDRMTRIGELIAAAADASPTRRALLVDALVALQPIGAPPWVLESAQAGVEPAPAQRSSATLARLLERLDADDPEVRDAAVAELLDWTDVHAAHVEVLLAWLDERVEVSVDRQWVLADALDAHPTHVRCARSVELLEWLPMDRRRRHAERLWGLWRGDDPAVKAAAGKTLRRLGAAFILPQVAAEIDACNPDAADLLGEGTLPRGPALDAVIEGVRAAGRESLALQLAQRAVAGPLGTPDPRPAPRPTRRAGADRLARIEAARGDDPQAARIALKHLVEAKAPGTLELLVDLTRHPDPARRILALRAVRQLADEATYLDAALPFLADPRPDVCRSVIEALSEARHPDALAQIMDLLQDRNRQIRDAARNGVIRYRKAALPALEHALQRARPDRRALYRGIIAVIEDLIASPPDASIL